jgi:hypothetical protein
MENEHEHEKTIGYQPKALDYMNRKDEKKLLGNASEAAHMAGWL